MPTFKETLYSSKFTLYKKLLIFASLKIEQNLKLGKIKDVQNATLQRVEILCALQKLGEKLNEEEEMFLSSNLSNNMKQFEIASDSAKIGILKF